MIKEVVVAILASVGTALVFTLGGFIGSVTNEISIPKGAVVAFDSSECPEEGWEDFKHAYGQFIRGIDKSGTNVDPDGKREPASPQGSAIESHSHPQVYGDVKGHFSSDGWETVPHVTKSGKNGVHTAPIGGSETRPKNIALLYCVKS